MIPDPLKITLGGVDYSLPELKLRQLRQLRVAVQQSGVEGRAGLALIDTGIEIVSIALGKSEDELAGTIDEVSAAAEAILKFAGFTVEGEAAGAPAATQTIDGEAYTGA